MIPTSTRPNEGVGNDGEEEGDDNEEEGDDDEEEGDDGEEEGDDGEEEGDDKTKGAVGGVEPKPQFSVRETNRLNKMKLDSTLTTLPSEYKLNNIRDYLRHKYENTKSEYTRKSLSNKYDTFVKYRKIVHALKNAQEKEVTFIPDEDVKELSKSSKHKSGKGLKIGSDYKFGNLYIDPNKLLEMRLEAYNNNGKK